MAKLKVTVNTKTEAYNGFIELAANSTVADARQAAQSLIGGVNEITSLSIENDGVATIFGKKVLEESVITVAIVE